MDISSFLGGSFLTHLDLPQQPAVWTIVNVTQQLVGADEKICVRFQQHNKPLGLNKINLRVIAAAYSTNSQTWIGKSLELFKDKTQFQGRTVPCIRVRIPAQNNQPQVAPAVQPVTQKIENYLALKLS